MNRALNFLSRQTMSLGRPRAPLEYKRCRCGRCHSCYRSIEAAEQKRVRRYDARITQRARSAAGQWLAAVRHRVEMSGYLNTYPMPRQLTITAFVDGAQ